MSAADREGCAVEMPMRAITSGAMSCSYLGPAVAGDAIQGGRRATRPKFPRAR
jgi:hypothetical protein